MLAQEAGESVAEDVFRKLSEQVSGSEFAQYLGGGELSAQQIAELRAKVEEEVIETLGTVGEALSKVDEVTPDVWLKLEASLQDSIAGLVGDDLRDFLSTFEVPEKFEDAFCEIEGD